MTAPLPVHGIDISHHQSGNLDIAGAARRGLRWLYHKATEGDSYTDPLYARRRAEAKKAGLPFGAYHFARPERSDAAAEARSFLRYAKPVPGDLRPALDLETDEGLSLEQLRTWADTWCDVVRKALGVEPIIYTPFDLGRAQVERLIWRPRYNNDNRPPVLHDWDIWQFSNGSFGVPNILAGIGHVDLNTMRPTLRVAEMLIPKPKPEPAKAIRVDITHFPLQFSISDKATTHDLEAGFKRAADRGVKIISGTEAGPGAGNTSAELQRLGDKYGFRMWIPSNHKGTGSATDCWVGVAKTFILGGWETGFEPAIPGSKELYRRAGVDVEFPRWGPKGLVWVSFDSPLGRWSHGAAHYLTGARDPQHATEHGVDHWEWNTRLTEVIGRWAKEKGVGSALVTYAGDQNMADQRNDQPQGDTFLGQPLTSLGDALERWPSTGHGPIDVIATYDKDGRVEAAYWRALNDKRFPLEQDHFYCEGGVDVKPLKAS